MAAFWFSAAGDGSTAALRSASSPYSTSRPLASGTALLTLLPRCGAFRFVSAPPGPGCAQRAVAGWLSVSWRCAPRENLIAIGRPARTVAERQAPRSSSSGGDVTHAARSVRAKNALGWREPVDGRVDGHTAAGGIVVPVLSTPESQEVGAVVGRLRHGCRVAVRIRETGATGTEQTGAAIGQRDGSAPESPASLLPRRVRRRVVAMRHREVFQRRRRLGLAVRLAAAPGPAFWEQTG